MTAKETKLTSPRKFSSISSLKEVSESEWDACAGDENPFLSYKFLSSLEDSGSVEPETGWLPQHITCRDDKGELIGVVPLSLRVTHMVSIFSTGVGRMLGSELGINTFRNYYLQYLSRL